MSQQLRSDISGLYCSACWSASIAIIALGCVNWTIYAVGDPVFGRAVVISFIGFVLQSAEPAPQMGAPRCRGSKPLNERRFDADVCQAPGTHACGQIELAAAYPCTEHNEVMSRCIARATSIHLQGGPGARSRHPMGSARGGPARIPRSGAPDSRV